MHSGAIALADLAGPFDLQSTIESGQTYLWRRADGQAYEQPEAYGGDAWYETVYPAADSSTNEPEVVRARQHEGKIEWEGSVDAEPILRELLRLDDDLDAIMAATPDDPLIDAAYDRYPGLRLVRDPSFPCLISFICSAQMRVSRIHGMQIALAESLGERVEFDGRTYHAYPTPEALANATEDELRDLGLGYRAPYVVRTARMVADGDVHPDDARGLDYEDARAQLTEFVGVGDKVSDCILLFSLDYLEAVPLDTWIRSTIEDYYPHCAKGNYRETAQAIREQFGGEYAGYAQTYVFHYLRNGGEAPAGFDD